MHLFGKASSLSMGLAVLALAFVPSEARATPPTNIVFTGTFSGSFTTTGSVGTATGSGTTTNYDTANELLSDALTLVSANHYTTSGTDIFTFTGSSPFVGQTLTGTVAGLYNSTTNVVTGIDTFTSSSFGPVTGSSSFVGTFNPGAHTYNITFTAIPEPAPYLAFGLGAVGLAGLALRTRRRVLSLA